MQRINGSTYQGTLGLNDICISRCVHVGYVKYVSTRAKGVYKTYTAHKTPERQVQRSTSPLHEADGTIPWLPGVMGAPKPVFQSLVTLIFDL